MSFIHSGPFGGAELQTDITFRNPGSLRPKRIRTRTGVFATGEWSSRDGFKAGILEERAYLLRLASVAYLTS